MAHRDSVARTRVTDHLLVTSRLRAPLSVLLPVATAAVCGVAGALTLNAQQHFAGRVGEGALPTLLGTGSTALTAWEGWAAAALFALALLRVERGAPEPPAGRSPVEQMSTAQLRTGLRREYVAARVVLSVLLVASLIEAARAVRYTLATATGDAIAATSFAATLTEALGVMAATGVLAAWVLAYGRQLERVGALPDGQGL